MLSRITFAVVEDHLAVVEDQLYALDGLPHAVEDHLHAAEAWQSIDALHAVKSLVGHCTT